LFSPQSLIPSYRIARFAARFALGRPLDDGRQSATAL
jgi:hypothetical protein